MNHLAFVQNVFLRILSSNLFHQQTKQEPCAEIVAIITLCHICLRKVNEVQTSRQDGVTE